MLTRPIPDDALEVVALLRRDVPRPIELPVMQWAHMPLVNSSQQVLRWSMWQNKWTCCPMGMHPCAKSPVPCSVWSWPVCSSSMAIQVFADWWDEQTDAEAAVQAIWPQRVVDEWI